VAAHALAGGAELAVRRLREPWIGAPDLDLALTLTLTRRREAAACGADFTDPRAERRHSRRRPRVAGVAASKELTAERGLMPFPCGELRGVRRPTPQRSRAAAYHPPMGLRQVRDAPPPRRRATDGGPIRHGSLLRGERRPWG
jgi:hypothetical protein